MNLQSQFLEATNLDGFDFVGIVEEYSKSIHHLGDYIGRNLTASTPKNVNPRKENDYVIDGRIERLIIRNNEIDHEIYKLAKERLDRM